MHNPWSIKSQICRWKHFIYHIMFHLLLSCFCLLGPRNTIWCTSYCVYTSFMSIKNNKLVEWSHKWSIREYQVAWLYLGVNLKSKSFNYRRYIVPFSCIYSNNAVFKSKNNLIYLSNSYDALNNHCNFEWVMLCPYQLLQKS